MCLVSKSAKINTVKTMIFSFRNNVTLIGGGPCSRELLAEARSIAPSLIAADGGAGQALALGHAPQKVIGDFDSLDDETRGKLPEEAFHQVTEQDSTDFEKVLRSVEAPLMIGVGFLGGRLDHELACLNALVSQAKGPCILLGETDLCFHLPGRIALDLPAGSRISLFPMAEVVVTGRGVVYPVDGLRMQPWGKIGTSNEVGSEGHVELEMDKSGMIVILPRAELAAAVAALT